MASYFNQSDSYIGVIEEIVKDSIGGINQRKLVFFHGTGTNLAAFP